MHYAKKIFRPPHEANTILLQVTTGCSHNKCRFCTSYKDITFKVEPMDQIEADLQEVRQFAPETDRIFLLSGDAFALSYDRLQALSDKIHSYLPKIKTISSMASVSNIKNKTVDQLKELLDLGYNDLYIGVESGLDKALDFMHKGHRVTDVLEQLRKLDASEYNYTCFYMVGMAGKGNYEENAIASAAMFNQLKPKRIALTSLTVFPDSLLYPDQTEGKFTEATELERTIEFQTFLKSLEIETYVESIHVTNGTYMVGNIPDDKERMIAELQIIIDNYDESRQRHRRLKLHSV